MSASILFCGIGIAIAQDGDNPESDHGRSSDDVPPHGGPVKLRRARGDRSHDAGRPAHGAPVEFSLDNAELPDVVRMISRITGRRFILPASSRTIHATVISESPVTAGEAYRAFLAILDINGLTLVPSGRYLRIVEEEGAPGLPLPVIGDGGETPDDERYLTRMHRVSNVSADDVAALLDRFKSASGNITAYLPTNTVIITDTGTNIRRMLRILQEIDVPRTNEQLWIEPIHYASATELAERLREIFPVGGGDPATRQAPASGGERAGARGANASAPASIGGRASTPALTNILADERTNSLIIVATERAYLRVLEVIRALDVAVEGEGSVHVYPLQYADSAQIGSTLESLIGGGGGSGGGEAQGRAAQSGGLHAFEGRVEIHPYEATNSIVIISSQHDYVAMRSIIEQLDTEPRQVFIEAVIMELGAEHSTDLGISYHGGAMNTPSDGALWVFGFDAANTATSSVSSDMLTGLALGVRGPLIDQSSQLLGFSIPQFGVMLNAVARSGDVNILSTPHIIAMDNVQAEISVGANVPLQTSGITGFGSNLSALTALAGGSNNAASSALSNLTAGSGVQRQNVGTTIRITPHINDANEIRMEIEEEISDAGEAQGTLGVVPINQRIANTQVVVRDQQTVVIGGLMRDHIRTSEDGIPVLSEIPLLGALFRRRSTTVQKTNLLLFLTPYVIRSPSDLRAIFERKLRERQEFIDRYFVMNDQEHRPAVDYSRTRGLVAEMLNAVAEVDARAALREEARARAPQGHVPHAPLGAASLDAVEGELTIEPENDEGAGDGEATLAAPAPTE